MRDWAIVLVSLSIGIPAGLGLSYLIQRQVPPPIIQSAHLTVTAHILPNETCKDNKPCMYFDSLSVDSRHTTCEIDTISAKDGSVNEYTVPCAFMFGAEKGGKK